LSQRIIDVFEKYTVLLEKRQFYHESVETFSDAFSIHRSIIAEQQSLKRFSHNRCNDLMKEALGKASKRLAHGHIDINENVRNLALDPFVVLDMSNSDCMRSVLKFGSAIDQIDFVVRMNEEDFENVNNDDSISKNSRKNLGSAILFLNFGVACKRASEFTNANDIGDKMLDEMHRRSTELFDLSYQLINHEIECLYSAIKCCSITYNLEIEHYLERAIMVSMFTAAYITESMYWRHSMEENIIEDGSKFDSYFEKSFKLFQRLAFKRSPLSGVPHAASA
jgi:hypothetical protein